MNVRKHIFNFVALFVGLAFGYLGTQVDAAAAFMKKWTPNLALMTLEAANTTTCVYTVGWTTCHNDYLGCWAYAESETECESAYDVDEFTPVWGCKFASPGNEQYEDCQDSTSQYVQCYEVIDCEWTDNDWCVTGDAFSRPVYGGPNGYIATPCS